MISTCSWQTFLYYPLVPCQERGTGRAVRRGKVAEGRPREEKKGAHPLLLFSVTPVQFLLAFLLHFPFLQPLDISCHPSNSHVHGGSIWGKNNLLLEWMYVADSWFTAYGKDHKVPCMKALCTQLPTSSAAHAFFLLSKLVIFRAKE